MVACNSFRRLPRRLMLVGVLSLMFVAAPAFAADQKSASLALDPEGDTDGDGLANQEEANYGTKPNVGGQDTDGDGIVDGLDGWAREKEIKTPRLPKTQYAIIEIEKLGYPNSHVNGIDDNGNILLGEPSIPLLFNLATGQSTVISFTPWTLSHNGFVGGHGANGNDFAGKVLNAANSAVSTLPFPAYTDVPNRSRTWSVASTNGTISVGYLTYSGYTKDGQNRVSESWGGEGAILYPDDPRFQPTRYHFKFTYDSSGKSTTTVLENYAGINAYCSPFMVNAQGLIAVRNGAKTIFVNGSTFETADGQIDDLSDGPNAFGISNTARLLYFYGNGGWTQKPLQIWGASSLTGPDDSDQPASPIAVNQRGEMMGGAGESLLRNGKSFDIFASDPAGWDGVTDGEPHKLVWLNNKGWIAARAFKVTSSGDKPTAIALVPCDIAVDANRDGVIKFAGNYNSTATNLVGKPQDKTSENKPFRFWINNDQDDNAATTPDSNPEKVPAVTPDFTLNQIKTKRDLEDFSLLALNFGAFYDKLVDGTFKIGLKWKGSTTAKIKVYRSANPDGVSLDGKSYLNDDSQASAQIAGTYAAAIGEVSGTQPLMLPPDVWTGYSETNAKKFLLFEGSAEGKGELEMVIQKGDGTPLGEGGSVWLDLVNVRKMYRRVKATGISDNYPEPSQTTPGNPPEPSMSWVEDPNGNPYDDQAKFSWQETKDYIVLVHGWNMSYEGAENYGEIMFKRLWQRGYKGRYAFMRWPTMDDSFGVPYTYNASEYRAWKCGESLKQFMASLPGGYTKNLVSHSMGAVVCGSALQKGMTVDNYAICHGALSAACYDDSPSLDRGWGYTTPHYDSDPGTRNLSYRYKLNSAGGNLINFFLDFDSALQAWELNNYTSGPGSLGAKPQRYNLGTTGYYYSPSATVGQRLGITYQTAVGRFVTDPHEAMAYVAQSPAKAVGREILTEGSIDDFVIMSLYGFGTVHSAEYTFTLQKSVEFYDELLFRFDITSIP